MTKDEAFAKLAQSKFRSRFKFLDKWLKVARGRDLSEAQQSKAVNFLMSWIDVKLDKSNCEYTVCAIY